MRHLILCPSKLLEATPVHQWKSCLREKTVLFTSKPPAGENTVFSRIIPLFEKVVVFGDYAENDTLELEAIQLHIESPWNRVVALSEVDLFRAARIREHCNLEGETLEQLLPFRNKSTMKNVARAKGVKVADFLEVCDPVTLFAFAEKHDFKIVVKPVAGRGSFGTYRVSSKAELMARMQHGVFSKFDFGVSLLVEAFVEGEMYHIDGLYLENRIETLSSSKYESNCLSFVNGAALGSFTLASDNPDQIRLSQWARNLITNVFRLPKNCLFHIEAFINEAGEIILCEIAARLGGNGINDEVFFRLGVDIKFEYLNYELNGIRMGSPIYLSPNLVGRLLIPPQNGVIRNTVYHCPFDYVIRYQNRAKTGQKLTSMNMSNDDLASFLMVAPNETTMKERLKELCNWYNQTTLWNQ